MGVGGGGGGGGGGENEVRRNGQPWRTAKERRKGRKL